MTLCHHHTRVCLLPPAHKSALGLTCPCVHNDVRQQAFRTHRQQTVDNRKGLVQLWCAQGQMLENSNVASATC